MKDDEQQMIRKNMDALAKEMEDASRVLREAEEPDRTGIATLITEAALVLAVGLLWWFVRGTAFVKSAWFPWVAVTVPIIALGVPLALTIRSRRRRANKQIHPIAGKPGSG
jgi:hypothetical protein